MSILTLLFFACSEPATPVAESPPSAPTESVAPAPVPDAAASAERVAARHVLVAWRGAVGAQPSQRRSKEEARTRADEALQKLRAGEDFGKIARAYSDDGSATQGGSLGAFGRGEMDAAFERAAFALAPGQLSELVETPFGYHIIQREALVEAHMAQILVQWSSETRTDLTRTREEARARAEEALASLNAGETFESVAQRYSDGPAASFGGDLGWFQRGQMVPLLDDAAFALAPGQTSTLLESPLGYHILKRIE